VLKTLTPLRKPVMRLQVAVICVVLAYYSRQAVVPHGEPTPDRVRA